MTEVWGVRGGPAQYKVEVRAAGGTGLSHRDGSQSQSCHPVTGSPQCVCVRVCLCKEGRWGGGGGRGGGNPSRLETGSRRAAAVAANPHEALGSSNQSVGTNLQQGMRGKKKKKGLSHHVLGGGGVRRRGRLVSSAARPSVPRSQSNLFSHFKRRHAQPWKHGNGNERQTDDGRVQRL